VVWLGDREVKMPDARFSVSQVSNRLTWVVVDDAHEKQLVASSPNYDCALMIAALMNGDMVQAVQYRDDVLRMTPGRAGS
jgi:hypothetical protein